MSFRYGLILVALLSLFALYNAIIYSSTSDYGKVSLSEKALNGEQVWLQNNCNACHQLYGLGGYLGPDLTNEYTRINNEAYLKAMINSGVKVMPKFNFSTTQLNDLIQFLKEVDQTGYYPNMEAVTRAYGWVNLKYKTPLHEK
ncbi:c-type cytochrome [Flavobacterium silvisoli]|nr:cytochrome c [Flavobacterium silvisoli]